MKGIKVFTAICIVVLQYSNSFSFDGERNGFILGGGIGTGYLINVNWTSKITNTVDSRIVLFTNFKIGYAPSNTVEFFFVNKASWWSESDIAKVLGLSALASTFFFNNEAENGLFISGGLGLSTLSAPFENNVESSNGFGLFAGVGYEFQSHWNVELDLLYSSLNEPHSDSFGIQLTINVLAY
jgi:opacity protein-like surface antigen